MTPGGRWGHGRFGVAPRPGLQNKEMTMVTYIGLMKFTDKGIQGVKDTTRRAAAAKEVAGRFGVTMREIYWTLGEYDVVSVLDAQDEASLTAFNLAIAAQGNVRSQSLRAFTSAEMDKVLAKLP
jgi:uncharacterized protein with GYD domain